MTQGIAFARTIRALEADDFRSSKLGLGVAAMLLLAWTWWMLAARVPQYETAADVRMESGRAIATFASPARIRPGQAGFLVLGGATVPARVLNVAGNHAELVFSSHQPLITNEASAEIEVDRISPAEILLRMLKRGR
jgi:hypothetical protein